MSAARAQGMADLPSRTLLFTRDRNVTLQELDSDTALVLLATFVDGYRRGLEQPLPLFEKSSYVFAETLADKGDEQLARRKALAEWQANTSERGSPNDSEDGAIELCLRGRDAHALPEFATWARKVWLPYLQCQREGKA
jgi:exonuclease V gamma subunit